MRTIFLIFPKRAPILFCPYEKGIPKKFIQRLQAFPNFGMEIPAEYCTHRLSQNPKNFEWGSKYDILSLEFNILVTLICFYVSMRCVQKITGTVSSTLMLSPSK